MTALVVFDIEAVPDLEMARRLLAQPDGTADAEISRASRGSTVKGQGQAIDAVW